MPKSKEPSYYGGYYWISITSFLVPLIVAYAAFSKITPTTKPTPQPDASGVDHHLWDYLLRTYVENGLIDYHGMSKDYLFTTYLRQIAAAEPDKLETDDEKLALHCNAYNALVIHGVIIHKIHQNEKNVLNFTPKGVAERLEKLDKEIDALKRRPESEPAEIDQLMKQADQIRRESQFFELEEHVFANTTMSLNHLEHQIIRPVFQDPRIHVALVCAAKSCPAIRPEAYVGSRIDKQLDDQARLFANDTRYVSYNEADNAIRLSPILKWYSEDWDASGGYLLWLHARVKSATLQEKLQSANANEVSVEFNKYDWTLNSQAGSGGTTSTTGGGFGSGSVPNE